MAGDEEGQPMIEQDNVQDVALVGNVDWFLQQIIDTVIFFGVDIGVTLTVGGTTISGVMISGKKYFEQLGESLSQASTSPGDVQSVLANSWSQFTAIYEKPEGAADDWVAPPAGYIHLKDAYIFAPGGPPMPSNRGILWRGRLSSVDGWAMGNMSSN